MRNLLAVLACLAGSDGVYFVTTPRAVATYRRWLLIDLL
jgi:hypothetical protein